MKTSIFKSAAMVTTFSIIEKLVSFFYHIFLSRTIGAEGVGLYQVCLSVFAVFLTASSSGIPVTVSRLIAKHNADGNEKGKHAAVTAGVVCTLFVTIPVVVLFFIFRNNLYGMFSDDRCIRIFLVLLPGLIITSIYAVMRGTFWGKKQFLPYSLIELAEDTLMVVLGCIMVLGANNAADGALKATYAVIISYVFSFIVSTVHYLRSGGQFANPKTQLKPLLSSALPVTAMRTASSLINSAIAILLPMILTNACGYSPADAMALYGIALGMSIPILFSPATLIGSISVVMAPELSENYYRGNTKSVNEDVEKCLKAATLIATVLVPLLFTLGVDLGELIYSQRLAGEIISRCAFMMLPMSISMLTTTVLNSLNCESKTIVTYFIGAACMLTCVFTLTPFIGIYGYMVGLALDFSISTVLNLVLLRKKCKEIHCVKYILLCCAVCLAASLFGAFTQNLIIDRIPAIARLFVSGALVFTFTCIALWAMGLIGIAPVINLIKNKFNGKKLPVLLPKKSKKHQTNA